MPWLYQHQCLGGGISPQRHATMRLGVVFAPFHYASGQNFVYMETRFKLAAFGSEQSFPYILARCNFSLDTEFVDVPW
jgi:hypothetical protein